VCACARACVCVSNVYGGGKYTTDKDAVCLGRKSKNYVEP
jgi:hypothetical protein